MPAEWLIRSPIAHRGLWDTAECPENSLAAFRKAAARGIPFELDVQLTRDGQLAVVHDSNLERLTGKPCTVADLDLADLRRLRIGGTGESIPVLAEVLEIAGGVPFVIDVRQWRGPRNGTLENAVLAAVRGYDGPFALQSFDPMAVFRMRRRAGDHPVGQASGNLRSAGQIARVLGRPMVANAITRPSFISYELSAFPSSWVRFWRRLGIPVLAWTVRSPAMETEAVRVADNFFFDGYLPRAYGGDLGLRRDLRTDERLTCFLACLVPIASRSRNQSRTPPRQRSPAGPRTGSGESGHTTTSGRGATGDGTATAGSRSSSLVQACPC